MRLSFDDEDSFKETVESLRFNNLPSGPNASQQMGSSGSIPLEDSETERNGDDTFPSDQIILRRVGSTVLLRPVVHGL